MISIVPWNSIWGARARIKAPGRKVPVCLLPTCASEALTVASVMRRHNEIAIARALLASGGEAGSAQDIEATSGRDDLSVRARAALLASQARPRDSNGGFHAEPVG
jgi:hypothetical protein